MMNSFLWQVSAIALVAGISACTSRIPNSASQPVSKTPTPAAIAPKEPIAWSDADSSALAKLSLMTNEQFSLYVNGDATDGIMDGPTEQFSATGKGITGGLPPADNDYTYQIVRVTPTMVYMTATANRPNLRSLSAQAFAVPKENRAQVFNKSSVVGSICVTHAPSQSAPAESADVVGVEPTCPSGSFSAGVWYPYQESPAIRLLR